MLRLRPYKNCDAKEIVTWCQDEIAFRKWKLPERTYQNKNKGDRTIPLPHCIKHIIINSSSFSSIISKPTFLYILTA